MKKLMCVPICALLLAPVGLFAEDKPAAKKTTEKGKVNSQKVDKNSPASSWDWGNRGKAQKSNQKRTSAKQQAQAAK